MAQVGQYGDYKSYRFFFQEFAKMGIGLFVLGHTHKYSLVVTRINSGQGPVIYANSGAWVDGYDPTFVTIQKEVGKPATSVKIFQVTGGGPKVVEESIISIRGSSSSYEGEPSSKEKKWAPEGWTCYPEFYNDSVCDCDCGVWDPDCSDERSQPRNCFNLSRQLNHTCDKKVNKCRYLKPRIPPNWSCDDSLFFNLEGVCYCNCTAFDPICYVSHSYSPCDGGRKDQGELVTYCLNMDGLANCTVYNDTLYSSIRKPNDRKTRENGGKEEWKCPKSFRGKNDGCDYYCGKEIDPDCTRLAETESSCDLWPEENISFERIRRT